MKQPDAFYLTTPIYYVNGKPHIGHAYTTIIADALCRWHRLLGHPTFFLTGTDEHGQKVMQSARARGMTPQAHCDDLVVHWKATFERLQISYDRFIRTTDQDHVDAVRTALAQLYDADLIEKRVYEGWYHVGDEIFVTEKDVQEGRYDPANLQRISEANYFFKMGSYQKRLIEHIEKNPTYIQPESRKNEVLGFLRRPLNDLCISRPKARMSWGIEIPFDKDYVTYVWFDALLNYLTGVGWSPGKPSDWQKWWPTNGHLIGKDILTTHSVYWSTMLMALDVPLPETIFAHGWWTSPEGDKMSKSLDNAIDIGLLMDSFGVDATRYFFLREKSLQSDGGFSYDGFLARYNADLANDLGNLAHRGLSMTQNWLGGVVPEIGDETGDEHALRTLGGETLAAYAKAMARFDIRTALEHVGVLVAAGNKYIDTQQPWAINKAGRKDRLATVKRAVLESCHLAASLLLPVMPSKAAELLGKLGSSPDAAEVWLRAELPHAAEASAGHWQARPALKAGSPITVGDPLFPRQKELPPQIAALFAAPAPEAAPPPPPPPKPAGKPDAKAAALAAAPDEIAYEDFAKVKLRVGKVLDAKRHPEADRLLVLTVDVGEEKPRTIVAGIAARFAPEQMVGRNIVVVANLKPAKLRGIESQGMLLAAGGPTDLELLTVDAKPGTPIK